MKLVFALFIIIINFTSCDHKRNNDKPASTFINKRYFKYDKIDYYFNPFDEKNLVELSRKRSNSEIDSFAHDVLIIEIPKDLSDLSFINKLEEVGYKKLSIPATAFPSIDSIFITKPAGEQLFLSCAIIFRDILVFKKADSVVGTAKICLGCMANQIHGTKENTETFGQDGDYNRLSLLLNKYR